MPRRIHQFQKLEIGRSDSRDQSQFRGRRAARMVVDFHDGQITGDRRQLVLVGRFGQCRPLERAVGSKARARTRVVADNVIGPVYSIAVGAMPPPGVRGSEPSSV